MSFDSLSTGDSPSCRTPKVSYESQPQGCDELAPPHCSLPKSKYKISAKELSESFKRANQSIAESSVSFQSLIQSLISPPKISDNSPVSRHLEISLDTSITKLTLLFGQQNQLGGQ